MNETMRLAILRALENKPSQYYGPCCCPGPGKIRDFQVDLPAHVVRVKRPDQKAAFISFVRRFYNMTLPEAQKLVNSDGIVFEEWLSTYFLEQLAAQGIDAEVVDFIDDMAVRYAETDLVICRAGAITISELTAAGVASLLVPFMASSTSHQKQNAVWMAAKQAALYVPQTELTPESLAKTIQELNRKQCSELAITAYALGRREASENIARILEELA